MSLRELVDHEAHLHLVCRRCGRYVIAPTRAWLEQWGDLPIYGIVARLRCESCGTPPDAFLVFDAIEATRAFPAGQAPKIVRHDTSRRMNILEARVSAGNRKNCGELY